MSDIILKYNGVTISPTPLVQQNYNFLDLGGGSRWGNVLEIELNGNLTGFTDYLGAQSGFAGNFTGQFGRLEVFEGAQSIYQWDSVIVDEINFPLNHMFVGTSPRSMAPYAVKMKVINVPSGVVEPVNEYSFNQGDDGIVTVNHKVSARGIRTVNGGLSNAVLFVQTFKGVNPFNSPFQAAFSPSGSGVLISFTEAIDRATSSYSIQEIYKYNTGLFNPYVETWSVSTSDVMDNEWLTVDVDWKLQGNPVVNNILSVEAGLSTNNPINKLSNIGYATGNFVQSSYNVTRDTGAALINIRSSYVSGYNVTDVLGYFDYIVSVSLDGVTPKEDWRIDGDFVCFGPLDYKRARLAAFKVTNQADWRGYLTGLIIASPPYGYHDTSRTFGSMSDLDMHENTGMAQFHLSLTTVDGGKTSTLWYPKYTLDVQPNKWNYDFLPSSNIEGHYVLQDLQMMSQGKINLSVEGQSRDTRAGLLSASGFLTTLSGVYIGNGFITSDSYNTGIFGVSAQREWLGLDNMSSGLLFTKVAGTNLINYLRQPGFLFGY